MKIYHGVALFLFLLQGCIGDDIINDFVPERVQIISTLDTLKVGDSFQLEATFFDEAGRAQSLEINWKSLEPTVISVDNKRIARALKAGLAGIVASASLPVSGKTVADTITVIAGKATVVNSNENQRNGKLNSTSSYVLEGDFSLKNNSSGNIVLDFDSNYKASSSLPGLYVYLTNNPTTTNGALEIGKVVVFNGAHSYTLPSNVQLNTYSHVLFFCKPFNVKVGDGKFEN